MKTKKILVIVFMICNINISYAKENEYTIDEVLDIESKEVEYVKHLNELEKELEVIESKNKEDSNVVTVSFIEGNMSYRYSMDSEINKLKEQIDFIKDDIEDIEKEKELLLDDISKMTKETLEDEEKDMVDIYWPLEEYIQVSSHYGYRMHPITKEWKGHKGTDIPAPEGTDILSSNDGVVIFSNYQGGYGNVVKIKHFDDTVTVYAHNSKNVVNEGDIVKQGDVIAKVGSTGDSTGNHVHFEVIHDDSNIDPMDISKYY